MAGENPFERALLAQIEERRQTDPLIGAKLGGKEVAQRLIAALKNDKGVHIESLLCAVGALAGYSCQAAVRAQARAASVDVTSWLTVVQTKDGHRYFFGDRLNDLLLEAKYSVWSIAAGGAQQAGSTDLPNVAEMVQYNASVLGSDAFGRPRLPDGHACGDLPANYARTFYPPLQPLVTKFCPDPRHWPVLFALAAQEIIIMGKTVLNPGLALRIVMESALPVSHIDFGFERESKPPAQSASSSAPSTPPVAARAPARSKNWVVWALVLIIVGAFQLPRLFSSPPRGSAPPRPVMSHGAGIDRLLHEGKLRIATQADYQRWEQYAARNGKGNRRADEAEMALGLLRMYVVTGPMAFPDDPPTALAPAFIVLPGVPRPEGDPGNAIMLSMNR